MNIPLATIAIIVLLLPGVAFFYAASLAQKKSVELVRTSAIGDVAGAIFASIVAHLLLYLVLKFGLGRNLSGYLRYIFIGDVLFLLKSYLNIEVFALKTLVYIIFSCFFGALLGFFWSLAIRWKCLRWLVRGGWYSDLISDGDRLVTAYIMTSTKESGKILMYGGQLIEYSIGSDGNFLYVVLGNAKKYFLYFESEKMTKQLDLFDLSQPNHKDQIIAYLVIPGGSISNILFEKTAKLDIDKNTNNEIDEAILKIESTGGA